MKTERLPSLKQMLIRSNSGHRSLLRAARDGSSLSTSTDGAYWGYKRCLATLIQWDCLEQGKLTDRGVQLLGALEERFQEHQRSRKMYSAYSDQK